MRDDSTTVLSPYRWVILVIAALTAMIGTYAQMQVSPLAYKLIPLLHLTSSQFAAIATAPMVGPIFLGIFAGSLVDRYGPKMVVGVASALSVIGITFRYAAMSFWPFFILSILVGLGAGLLSSSIPKLFGSWFPQEQMVSAMGIYMIFPMAGQVLALGTTALFPSLTSAFVTAGLISLVVFILWLICIKDRPEGAPELPSMPVTQYLGKAARSVNVWLVGISLFLIMGGNMVICAFIPNALHILKGIDPVAAGFYGSLVTLGEALGALVGPLLCNRIGVMKPFLVITSLLGAAGCLLFLYTPLGLATGVVVILTGFMILACYTPLFAVPMLLPEIGPVFAGSAGGIISTMMTIGAVVLPTFVITPLAGSNTAKLFVLAALCMALVVVPVLFLPELGTKTLAARTAAGTNQEA